MTGLSRRRSRVRVPSLPLSICRDFLKTPPDRPHTRPHTCHTGGEPAKRESRDFCLLAFLSPSGHGHARKRTSGHGLPNRSKHARRRSSGVFLLGCGGPPLGAALSCSHVSVESESSLAARALEQMAVTAEHKDAAVCVSELLGARVAAPAAVELQGPVNRSCASSRWSSCPRGGWCPCSEQTRHGRTWQGQTPAMSRRDGPSRATPPARTRARAARLHAAAGGAGSRTTPAHRPARSRRRPRRKCSSRA
jgi:hypothetical protein